jgi:transcriptional regulator GlxA family with amidase domain
MVPPYRSAAPLSRRARTHLDQFRTLPPVTDPPDFWFNAGSQARCPKMPRRTDLIDVLFVISSHSLLLDIAGPAEAFRLANLHRARARLADRFRLRFAAPTSKMPTSVGLTLTDLEPLPLHLDSPTWVVLVGQPNVHASRATPAVIATAQWLSRALHTRLAAADRADRLITICSGALLAARAGLLGSRRCTTHHEMLGALRRLAPEAQVVDNRVFVVDGPLSSSAGVAAGIDLALHLIAAECGEALAASIAKDMAVYLRRSARDPELSPFLGQRRHTHAAVHKVQDAITEDPQRDWDMAALAALGNVTQRHLLRLFTDHAGASPMQCLQAIRLERARQSLEHGVSVSTAAEISGFRSSLNLRRAWSKQWGGSPRDAHRAEVPSAPAALR